MEDAASALSSQAFEPEPRPKAQKINLQLVMKSSSTKEELGDYDKLSFEEVLEKAQTLKTLHLEWQSIAEIANLEPFEATEVLYLQYNRIERIEGLDFMPKLQFLALQHNQIKVVENLLHLRELEFLDLSGNQITELNTSELPQSINILKLKDNPCAKRFDYQERLLARLPDLLYLDGKELQAAEQADGGLPALSGGCEEELTLTSGERGLGAYYRREELQDGMRANTHDMIEAYSIEVLADEDFSGRVDSAVKRSDARRKKLQEQLTIVKAAYEKASARAAEKRAEAPAELAVVAESADTSETAIDS
mmetsp:Transcript_57519/g.100724  ORF Transcript_57519/g.100724 Transcript_57519/m.100724 type:complete len:308 (+) Transcript_57519:76-999(+)